MLSYEENREKRLLKQFDLLLKNGESLPNDAYLFVADEYGRICRFKGTDDFGVEFPCLLKYVNEKERERCLKNSAVGRSGIYHCVGEKGRFISVEPSENGGGCTVIDMTEKNCESMEQYLEVLLGTRAFLKGLEKRMLPSRERLPQSELVECRIAAARELVGLCRGENDEGDGELSAMTGKILEKAAKICGMFSVRLVCVSHENESRYVSVQRKLLRALLYTIAFLSRSGNSGEINVSVEKCDEGIRLGFFAEYEKSSYDGLYFNTIIRILSHFGNSCFASANGDKISMTAILRLCSEEKLRVTDIGEAEAAVDETLFSDITLEAFGMIAGKF